VARHHRFGLAIHRTIRNGVGAWMDAFAGLGDCRNRKPARSGARNCRSADTTAAGLFAAIPAVIAYNHYLSSIRGVATRMDNFASEFVSKIETIYSPN